MKNRLMENLKTRMRLYHKRHPWRLNREGLFIPHAYPEEKQVHLSWWDDFGFILNDRRIIVGWLHPRQVYLDAMEKQAWSMVEPCVSMPSPTQAAKPCYQKVGRSRKKVKYYTMPLPDEASQQCFRAYQDRLHALKIEGIDLEVRPSILRQRLPWAESVTLVAPVEVRSESDIRALADLVRGLLLGRRTLLESFPNYRYGRSDWRSDMARLNETP